jgi:hypothetical protein
VQDQIRKGALYLNAPIKCERHKVADFGSISRKKKNICYKHRIGFIILITTKQVVTVESFLSKNQIISFQTLVRKNIYFYMYLFQQDNPLPHTSPLEKRIKNKTTHSRRLLAFRHNTIHLTDSTSSFLCASSLILRQSRCP